MSFLYIAYHHNWSGETDFRRHWLLFLATERGSNIGTAYDVAKDEHDVWVQRTKMEQDISMSGTYQDKVPLGIVEKTKLDDFEKVINEIDLPIGDQDCQDWVKGAVMRLVEEKIALSRAVAQMGMVPSN